MATTRPGNSPPAAAADGMETMVCTVRERAGLLAREHRFSSLRTQDLTTQDIERLASFMEMYRARRGTVIFREGDREATLYLVLEGEIEIVKEDAARGVRKLITLGPGKSFGEMALVDGETRSATAVAASDAALLALSRVKFEQLLDEFPRLGLKVLQSLTRVLSSRLRETSGRLVDHLAS